MSPLSTATTQTESLGDQVRKLADQLKEESALQIKVTSRILGAAAQISENHDRLITEVTNMVEEDLDREIFIQTITLYTVEQLKQTFKKLEDAKSHFGIKASSWGVLVTKLNNSSGQQNLPSSSNSTSKTKESIPERFNSIEHELKNLRSDTSQILVLLQQLISEH
jgi:ABC-type oligopeptide transport system ATPase subunit